MTASVAPVLSTRQPPLPDATLTRRTVAVLLGTLALTASSYISVPMQPVPMTMQTLAVTLVGALYGWRLGAITVLAWLLEAAVGLPVLANGGAGLARFVGPTGGYLLAFPLAAALTGFLVWRRAGALPMLRNVAAMLAGNAVCLALGGAWLATMVGPPRALAIGVLPFVLGGALKSILGAAVLQAHALNGSRR